MKKKKMGEIGNRISVNTNPNRALAAPTPMAGMKTKIHKKKGLFKS